MGQACSGSGGSQAEAATIAAAAPACLDARQHSQAGEAEGHEERVAQLRQQLQGSAVHCSRQLLHQVAPRLQAAQHRRRGLVAGQAPLLAPARGGGQGRAGSRRGVRLQDAAEQTALWKGSNHTFAIHPAAQLLHPPARIASCCQHAPTHP